MSSSQPDLAVRRPSPEEAGEVVALASALDEHFLDETDWSLDSLEEDWRDLDRERDTWVVAIEGRIAGYVALFDRGKHWLGDGYVHPAFFDRGVGTRLVELVEDEARSRGEPDVLRIATLSLDDRARSLLEARGYRAVRHFWRMRIELDGPPRAPRWPDGLRPEPFDLGRDGRAVKKAIDEAFAEEWSHDVEQYETWHARQLDRGRTGSESWVVVREEDEVAGVAVCDRERFGVGWVGALAVRRPWRRRGLGEAILLEAFGRFWRAGQRVVGLGVDAANPTRATRLYERVGMRPHWSATVYERGLERG